MRALLLVALIGCGFESGGNASDAGTDSGDDAPVDSLVIPGTVGASAVATSTIYYTNAGQFPYNVPTGTSLLLVGVSTSYAGSTLQSVRLGSIELTQVGFVNAQDDDGRVELWKLHDPPAGASAITVAVADANSALVIGVVSFSNTHATAPLGMFNSSQATSGGPTITVPSAAGQVVFGVAMWNGNYTTLTADSGQTSHWNQGVSAVIGAGSSEPGAATTTLRWTVNGGFDDYWAVGAVAIKPN